MADVDDPVDDPPARWPWAWMAPGLLALTLDPLRWLAQTWADPAYDSDGGWVAILVAAIGVRSLASGAPAGGRPVRAGVVAALLGATCAARLAGRLLDVHHLGALALVVDVGTTAAVLGLHRRPWAVAPWALAGLAAMTLPVEHALQQFVSFPLRVASAATVAAALAPLGVERVGTRLVDGSGGILDVEVACSGAAGLTALGVLAFTAATRRSLRPTTAALGLAAVVGGAWLANSVRLLLLVVGPTEAWLRQPAHTIVGLVALAVGLVPALAVVRALPQRVPPEPVAATPIRAASAGGARAAAAAFSAAGILAASAPSHPVDRSGPVAPIALPVVLGGWRSAAQPLTALEQAYFGRFGGRVDRRTYHTGADHTVLVVRTTAPLRHLHSPAACLAGAGHTVERLGLRPGAPIPTVVWRSVAPDGQVWRVETSFVSATGQTADSAAEVAWLWLGAPGTAWTLIERISPWRACEAAPDRCAAFETELLSALDVVIGHGGLAGGASVEHTCSSC